MQEINKTKLAKELNQELSAVEIIRSHENPDKCSVILNDRIFSWDYKMDFDFELISLIKEMVSEDVIVIMFVDNELPKAWEQSYLEGGITEDRFDRRVEFHSYEDMNELFCIDMMLLREIKGEFDGTPWEPCSWRKGIIKWYRNHLI